MKFSAKTVLIGASGSLMQEEDYIDQSALILKQNPACAEGLSGLRINIKEIFDGKQQNKT